MLRLGEQNIKGLYLGEQEIKKAYFGENLVFSAEKPSRLPEGYTEVQYISNPNLTSINDLGLSASPFANARLELKIKLLNIKTGANNIFGNDYFYSIRTGTSSYTRRSNDNRIYINGANHSVCLQNGYQASSSSGSASTIINEPSDDLEIIVDNPKRIFVVNGQEKSLVVNSVSNQYLLVPSLFATSLYSQSKPTVNGSTTTTNTKNSNPTNFEFYYFKIYLSTSTETGDLQHEYVPCISPYGEVGVYDMIAGTFWGSSDATKDFVAGPPI